MSFRMGLEIFVLGNKIESIYAGYRKRSTNHSGLTKTIPDLNQARTLYSVRHLMDVHSAMATRPNFPLPLFIVAAHLRRCHITMKCSCGL